MKTTTRFGLPALLVVAIALVTAGTALADKLSPPPGFFPSTASGTAQTTYSGPYLQSTPTGDVVYWIADTKFHVTGLTPRTECLFSVGDGQGGSGSLFFATGRNGNASGEILWTSYAGPGQASYEVDEFDDCLYCLGAIVLVGHE